MRLGQLWVFAFSYFLIGCSGVGEEDSEAFLSQRIPVAKVDSVLEASDSVRLEIGQVRKLISFGMLQAFGQAPLRDTMSVREIIAWVDSAEVRQAEQEAEAERLAREERERLARVRAQSDSVLTVAVVDKGFLPSSARAGRYDDYVTLDFVYENRSETEVVGFQGMVYFVDMFGDTIYGAGLKVDDPVPPGERLRQQRTIEYNQFSDDDQALRQLSLDRANVVWQPEVVILGDGRRMEVSGR